MKRILLVGGLVSVLIVIVFVTGAAAPRQTMPMSSPGFGEHHTKVFFAHDPASSTDCAEVRGFSRRTFGPDVLHDAMNQVLRGPREREARMGAWSFFSHRTAGLINSVRIRSGVAYIDFDDFRHIIPGASSSCGSTSLMEQLDRTALQFPTVHSTRFSFEGNRSVFYEWLQMSPP